MASLDYAPRALADLERLVDFLMEADPANAGETFDLIESAVSVLERHPLIGRPVEAGLRELVISRMRTGYLGIYHYDEARDRVLVLAIRHQREAGYT